MQKTLVEKDKEIENLTEELDDKNFCNDFVDLYTENKLKTQMLHENWKDKISFAVEQLTQAIKNIKKCNYKDFGIMYQSDAIAVIDNQINVLRKGGR